MEKFVVSARKYRPATFDTVVGQKVITSTLKSAITKGLLAQAYLFCGPRGVGKTTCARIFAKAINCMDLTPEGEPCGQCESCKMFEQQRSYNITELDAASNNSVDDLRRLTEQVQIPPQYGKYSVYIIDEVHMLTAQAFNAFLKTLEEPPPYAIFVLATTEKHKILETILSRCQIFDFNRIRVDDTIDYLASIAEREGVKYDREGLNLIALKADGAMRDALSTFDQVVSFSQRNITKENAVASLNILDLEYYFQITNDMLTHDYAHALLTLNEIVNKGFDLQQFVSGLSIHLRNLLVAQDAKSAEILEVGEVIAADYVARAKDIPAPLLMQGLMLIADAEATLRNSANQRLHVEVLLVALCAEEEEKKNA